VTIPISIAITLAILNLMGVQLQTVSLAGLVVVLGMVVDNAIVVIDDHIDKLDRGMMPWTAACESASELAVSVFTATVAIILVYSSLPILVTGQAGDFLRSLPVTIAVALAVSMLVALLLVPVMNAHLIQKGLHKEHGKRSMLDMIQGGFDSALEAAFRLPWLTVAAGLLSVAAAIFIALHIPIQMFPKIDRNQFAVEVYLPNGRSLEQTVAVIRRLESDLMADRRVTDVTSFIGQSSPRFHTVYAPHMPARNFGQLLVNTVSNEATIAVLHEDRLRYAGDFPEGWVRWKQLEFQFGFPVEIRLSGSDIDTLKQASAQIEAKARSIPGVTWVHNDYEAGCTACAVAGLGGNGHARLSGCHHLGR
jgi:multidrug efflux pump subunit AcrB